METLDKCPVCKTDSFIPYLLCTDYLVSRESFQIVQCSCCSFLFTNPRPNELEIGKYYESDNYISHTNSNKGIFNKVYQIVRNYSLRKKRELIESFNIRDKTLLDVGCGTGEFLYTFKDSQWKIKGLEPSQNARQYAIDSYKLNVEDSTSLFKILPKSFSVITMWHVLEHVHELDKYVIQLNNILKEDGVLVVAVPNPESFDSQIYKNNWAAYDVPRHLNHFTTKTMKILMENNDFSIEEILPMKFDSFYVSMLSEQNKGSNIIAMGMNGLSNGFESNRAGKRDIKNFSSLIYIIKKLKKSERTGLNF